MSALSDELFALFNQYGLGSLANTVLGLAQEDVDDSTFRLRLAESDTYKQRFAGNAKRRAAGLPALSPGEYLANERQYRQIMQAAGMPTGFYDDPSDFSDFIAKDTSPSEINDRVQSALKVAKSYSAAERQQLGASLGIVLEDGHIAAFVLDSKRALPVVQKWVDYIGVAAAQQRQGLRPDAKRAWDLADRGVTAEQAGQAYGAIAETTTAFGRAAKAQGSNYVQADAEDELLLSSASAKRKREQVESAFKATTASGTRANKGAMKTDTSGSY